MKQLYILLFVLLSFNSFSQWEIVPANTTDVLSDVQYKDGRYFVAGRDSGFLQSLG